MSDLFISHGFQVLNGSANEVIILLPFNASDPSAPPGRDSPALYPLFWRVGGEQCTIGWDNAFGSSGAAGGDGRRSNNTGSSNGAGMARSTGGADWMGVPHTNRLLGRMLWETLGGALWSPIQATTTSGVGERATGSMTSTGAALAAGRMRPWRWSDKTEAVVQVIGLNVHSMDRTATSDPPSALSGDGPLGHDGPSLSRSAPPRPPPPLPPGPPSAPPSPPSAPSSDSWNQQGVGCSLILRRGGADDGDGGGEDASKAGPPVSGWWWEIKCMTVDGEGMPVNDTLSGGMAEGATSIFSSGSAGSLGLSSEGRASCGEDVGGLRAVVVLEKVQTGILGATLSSFGITGVI